MPGLAPAEPNTHSTINISWANGDQHNSRIISPPRNMDQSCITEHLSFDHQNSVDCNELAHFDARKAEENFSLYCKPIQLYNIIQQRNSKNPIFLRRCLSYNIQAARKMRTKLKISVVNVSTTTSDSTLSTGKLKGWCQATNPPDLSPHPVLVMLTTPIPSSDMGYSCFRLGKTRVLRSDFVNICRSEDKGQSSVTFLLPEIQRMLECSERDGSTFVFISSVNSNASVLWGSISLTAMCKHWLGTCNDSNKELAPVFPALTIQVDLYPTRLQLINSAEERYLKFQSRSLACDSKCVAKLQLYISRDNLSSIVDDIDCETRSERALNYSSLLGLRLRPGQVVFHYHYFCNTLYKSEVTEDYTCPFCVRRCSELKGLRCHLNASHDLFMFEFIVTTDYRLVNVFCRKDMLGPEGNIRDFEGLNRLCLKHFIYWSKYRRHSKLSTPANNIERQSDEGGGLYECMNSAKNLSATGRHNAQNLEEFPKDQVLSSSLPKNGSYSSASWNGKSVESKDNILQSRKRERMDLKMMQITQHASIPLKKQRSEGFIASDSVGYGAFGDDILGSSSNGVCLAIAAPLLTDKARPQHTIKAAALHSKLLVDEHQKVLAERCEAQIRSQLMKRDLFQSHTSQPMTLEQLLSDRDSEDDNDDQVVDFEGHQMLGRFVDVAQHEKELMHLWNCFVRKQRILADGHCSWGCEAFSKLHAKKFNDNPSLRRCLMLFLTKLWNHNLVDGSTIDRCLFIVDSFIETVKTERNG